MIVSLRKSILTLAACLCLAGLTRADDLPEGIRDEELQRRFGGVGGAGYKALINEIEQRVNRCAAYGS